MSIKGLRSDNPQTAWVLTGELGSGSYGKVHAMKNRSNGNICAAKVAEVNRAGLADFATEINILRTCRHEGITNFIDGFYNEGSLWILIELADGGSLADLLDSGGSGGRSGGSRGSRGIPEAAVQAVASQMLSTLCFLHRNGVVHRDINASNTLVTRDGVVKIADFGISAYNKGRSAANDVKCRTFIGSPHWMAPEVVKCENDAKAR